LTAEEALEWGLINRVFPQDSFEDESFEVARRLAEAPTAAVAAAKNLLNQAAGMDRLDVHLDAELTELARIADGANFSEGIAAFFEKRAPKFESE
jgi:2-(1,2-epoxy-1,2-dihydrophenyl)acetyl-CoA isomerase